MHNDTTKLRLDQCCEREGCIKPARHGGLCSSCFMAATPGQRAVCKLVDDVPAMTPEQLTTDLQFWAITRDLGEAA